MAWRQYNSTYGLNRACSLAQKASQFIIGGDDDEKDRYKCVGHVIDDPFLFVQAMEP